MQSTPQNKRSALLLYQHLPQSNAAIPPPPSLHISPHTTISLHLPPLPNPSILGPFRQTFSRVSYPIPPVLTAPGAIQSRAACRISNSGGNTWPRAVSEWRCLNRTTVLGSLAAIGETGRSPCCGTKSFLRGQGRRRPNGTCVDSKSQVSRDLRTVHGSRPIAGEGTDIPRTRAR